MSPERWQQVKALFHAARARTSAERAALLDAVCADDAALRGEVESLLTAHEQTSDFLQRPVLAASPPATEPAAPAEGQLIGHYRVERRLGEGGMGVVYLARDTRLGRPVALKLLRADFTQDAERVRRFQQEARAASALNHPNILTIHEVGEADGAHFIAAEFIDGETLRARLTGAGMQLGEALDLLIQVAGALSAAHEARIMHRDIKPENIMVRPDGIVKVLDFGLAKLTEQSEPPPGAGFSNVTTQPGIVLGTVSYMSPEQARGLEVDARTDIFSFGVVLYEVLTGRTPFAGLTTSDVIVALLTSEPPPLARGLPGLPPALQQIVSRALAKPVTERYQTAAELWRDLKNLKQELELAARPTRPAARGATPLLMNVGTAATDDDHPTVATGVLVGRTTARLVALLRGLQRRGRSVALALAVLVLIITGISLGRSWLAPRGRAITSLAVLPFADAGDDPQMEYLPDGITESIIQSLSQLPELRVMARSTVFTYKGREIDPREVGAALNVRGVVTGRVSRRGERLVIRAELVDATDGSRLWGEQYQRSLTDIFTVQEEIAREISEALRLRLTGAEQRQLAKRHTADSEAYQYYLKGRYHYFQFTRPQQERALDYFNQAIALDPRYALAYAGIAEVYAEFSGQYLAPREAMSKAKQAALQAVALDEALDEAHCALALVKWWGDWDWAGAEREFGRSLQLNPNFVTANVYYADFLGRQGRFDEARRVIQHASELDPLSPHASNIKSNIFYYARKYDRAIEQCRKTLEPNPSGAWVGWAHGMMGRALTQQRRYPEAIAELERAVAIDRHDANLASLGYTYAAAGRSDDAWKIIQELEGQAARRRVSPIYIARIYVGLRERDRALDWLRKGYEEHSDHLLSLRVDPIYDGMRSDPRFTEILRGVGLAP